MKTFGNQIDDRVRLSATATEVFREITPEWREFYDRLARAGVLDRLNRQGLLLETVVVSKTPGEAPGLSFRQPRVPFVAYPHEWTAAMFRQAAERCLDLHEALFAEGLCLMDSHPWNFVFRGHEPRWVDLTSITAFDSRTAEAALRQFGSFFLNPLRLLSEGQEPIARALLSHAFADVPDTQADSILVSGDWQVLPWWRRLPRSLWAVQTQTLRILMRTFRRYRDFQRLDLSSPKESVRVVRRLRRDLAAIRPNRTRQEWTSYRQADQEPLIEQEVATGSIDPRRLANAKVQGLDTWLAKLKGEDRTLLDLGCNRGLFVQMARLAGFTAAGVDTDHGAVDDFFRSSRALDLAVSSAVNDFVAPREAVGMATNPLPAFAVRFQADVVLCLAVVHHLYFGRYQLSFDRIVHVLAPFTRRHLLLEFVPPDDPYLNGRYPVTRRTAGYTREAFVAAVQPAFEVLEICPSFPAGREIWVLQKR